MSRRKMYLTSKVLQFHPCPYCHVRLNAITGVKADAPFEPGMRITGMPTVCMECGAALTVASEAGKLRKQTPAEWEAMRTDPAARIVYETWNRIQEQRRRPDFDFTRKNPPRSGGLN